MKKIQFLLFLFCFSAALAQKQYNIELLFLTDSNEVAPHVEVTFIKENKTGAVMVKKVKADDKGLLKLSLSDAYFSKKDSLIIQSYYYTKDTYYFDYHEELAKNQFPFKKTVILEHIVPPTLEEINSSNVPPPPMLPKSSKKRSKNSR
ncbi:hypothetical protein [Chryseobacterium sp. Bi04]|uniref:hypothetical protein n=1 Tax=Chryseobacterium sp. Bi04 TaxID=2822345 RepID=UPI001DDDF215|nr:hypothetical protein [Chryseobacterium sp. Bi04]CAH0248608.1 hypothetical protein SRABI04_03170 [Chryseobacterium sp. Bi04]